MTPRVIDAHWVPWWPSGNGVTPAQVEYIGPWPDGGTGMRVKTFPAETVAESNRLAQGYVTALRIAGDTPVRESQDFWVIGEAA